MHSTTFFLVAYLVLGAISSVAAEIDQKRCDEIQSAIKADPQKLRGKSLEEVSMQLHLENVPWDSGYTSFPEGELRIYHFPGFSLHVPIWLLPRGATPKNLNGISFTQEELKRSGVRWVEGWNPPYVDIDKVHDRKERMARYWQGIERGLQQRAKATQK